MACRAPQNNFQRLTFDPIGQGAVCNPLDQQPHDSFCLRRDILANG